MRVGERHTEWGDREWWGGRETDRQSGGGERDRQSGEGEREREWWGRESGGEIEVSQCQKNQLLKTILLNAHTSFWATVNEMKIIF